MSKVIIFGIQDFASLAHYYFNNDTDHEVVAFSVSEKYIPDGKIFEGLPVIPFEEIENHYAPKEYKFFAPMSPSKMNRLREKIYYEIKEKGYLLVNYISSKATTFPDLNIGDNCFILEDNTIQPYVKIGNNVVLWSGNHIGHHSEIKDHVSFTSHVVLSGHCIVEAFSFLGVNATIRDGITIAEGSLIAMGASVLKSTEPWSIYKGNPAQKGSMSSKDIDF